MPHCSLEFSSIGLSVAVHSQWNKELTNCALRIFTSRQRADDFLAKIPNSERQEFAQCAAILESGTDTLGVLEVRGETALSLTSFLIGLSEETRFVGVLNKPDLMGFWGPPTVRASGTGIIMWFHPNDGYRAAIAYAKEQAEGVIRGLSWLQTRRQQQLLKQIEEWKMPRQSADAPLEIEGVIAELLCKASRVAQISVFAMERNRKRSHRMVQTMQFVKDDTVRLCPAGLPIAGKA